jgi:peptide/nickel transport system permease protein
MGRPRLMTYVPGLAETRVRGLSRLFSFFFYLYLVSGLLRAEEWVRLVRSPVLGERGQAVAVGAGLVLFYVAALAPVLAERRAFGEVLADRSRRFWRNRAAVAGLAVFTSFIFVALLAPLLTPYDPSAHAEAAQRLAAPSGSHPMGTDKFGRDVFARVLFGARVSMAVAVAAVALASLIGTLVGAFSGYIGGRTDDVAMRLVDGLLAFPRLLLLLTLVAFFASSFWIVVLAIALTGWMGVARLVRSEVLTLKEREFVQAAVASGVGRARIVWRHLIPNAMSTVIVAVTLRFALVILLEAYLSFLGLGVQPPTPSWGNMVFEGREVLLSAWWVSAFPGAAIAAAVVSCNLLGDGLRDALDVRLG